MFKLSEKYQIDGKFPKCDYIRYSPSEIRTINTVILHFFFEIPREVSLISLLKSFLYLNFDVLLAATNNRYVDNDDIWLTDLALIFLFGNFKLTTTSGNPLEDIIHAYIVSLMYKLLTSSRGSDDLSIGFDRDHNRRKLELTNNKNTKGNYHVRIYSKDIFGFAEHLEKVTYGLGYKLILTKNSDNAILNKNNATASGRIQIKSLGWYVTHYKSFFDQERVLMKQIVAKIPTALQNIEKSVFMKEVITQILWTSELVGAQE